MARAANRLFDPGVLAAAARRPAGAAAETAGEPQPAPVPARLIAGEYWRWLPLGGAWIALAFLIAFGIYVSNTGQGLNLSLTRGLYATIPHFIAWTLVSPALYRALYEVVAGRRRGLGVTLLIAWGAIAMASSTVFCYLGVALRDGVMPNSAGLMVFVAPPFGTAYQSMNFSILLLAVAAFGIVLGIRMHARSRWDATQQELRGARLEAQLTEARFQALQAQINPHFLLNCLNAIGNLVLKGERDRAFDALGGLGELLQTALRNGKAADMSLGDEVAFLERYLALCELRFGARFRHRLSVPESLRARRVPALIVQPLIENSIRHGMQPPHSLTVDIRAYEQDAAIVIEVEDDGRGLEAGIAGPLPSGHGLANVAERLRLFFGDGAVLQLERREPRGTRARIVCPQ